MRTIQQLGIRYLELAGIELLGERKEGLGALMEKINVKDGLGIRQIELGQIVIEAGARCAEIRNAGCRRYALPMSDN